MCRDVMQQPVWLRLAAMAAVGPTGSNSSRMPSCFSPWRADPHCHWSECDPKPGRRQAAERCQHPLSKPLHAPFLAKDAPFQPDSLICGKGVISAGNSACQVARISRKDPAAQTPSGSIWPEASLTPTASRRSARVAAGGGVRLKCQSVVGKRLHHRKPVPTRSRITPSLSKTSERIISLPGFAGSLGPTGQAPRGLWRSRFTDSTTGW